jgi:lysophospholipase L1-like esterase
MIWIAFTTAQPQPPQHPSLEPVEDVPGLPRVLLIGDSISMGYTVPVRELLADRANVHRVPENGGPTSRGIEQMEAWLGDGNWDLIHFNFGLHDLKMMEDGTFQVPIEQYERNLRQLVEEMAATGATLIWCSTTPVPDEVEGPARTNQDVMAYNEVAARIMAERGIAIDDLYSFALPRLADIQQPANVHFTPEGYEVLAQQVAASIGAALPE